MGVGLRRQTAAELRLLVQTVHWATGYHASAIVKLHLEYVAGI